MKRGKNQTSTDGFKFSLSDLKPELRKEMEQLVQPFVIPLIVDGQPCGTGTLVQFGKTCGILTAQHVASVIKKGKKLVTLAESYSNSLEIETVYLTEVLATKPKGSDVGPDLAFLAIPPVSFRDQLMARKSFLNGGKDWKSRCLQASRTGWGVVVFSGYPACLCFDAVADRHFKSVSGLKHMFAHCTGEELRERDGYDYLDLKVDYRTEPRSPTTFGGASGGSVWRVFVEREYNQPTGTETISGSCLIGVAFYQSDRDNDSRTIRCHGPKSIYEEFFPQVAEKLGH